MTYVYICQVERHLRKLDQEVSKFKMELEADNAGITEMLEKRRFYVVGFTLSSHVQAHSGRCPHVQSPINGIMPVCVCLN